MLIVYNVKGIAENTGLDIATIEAEFASGRLKNMPHLVGEDDGGYVASTEGITNWLEARAKVQQLTEQQEALWLKLTGIHDTGLE
jgi:hypothetical protein